MKKLPQLTHPKPSAAQAPAQRAANLAHHARKCAVCNHPQREEIDDDFFHWYSPAQIYNEYELPSVSALYRHANATGLLASRRRNLRGVSERILENVLDAHVSGSTVLRAMRIFAHVTEDGQWIEPPRETIVTHIHKFEPPESAPPVSKSHPMDGSRQGTALAVPKMTVASGVLTPEAGDVNGRPICEINSNNSQPVSVPCALEASAENKSLSSPLEKILIGNGNASRGEPND